MSSPKKIEKIFVDGDLTVHAGVGKDRQSFLVSSHVMRLASSEFGKMLASSTWFKDDKKTGLHLADASPTLLRIILNTIHLQREKVCTSLSGNNLVGLVLLCEKYDLAYAMKNTIHDAMIEFEQSDKVRWSTCTFIYYTLQDWTGVRAASKQLMLKMKRNASGTLVDDARQPFNPIFPAKLLDCIASTRHEVIDRLLQLYYGKMSSLMKGKGCTHPEASRACNMMSLGALTSHLYLGTLFDPRRSAAAITSSVELLHQKLTCITEDESSQKCRGSEHKCDIFQNLKPQADEIVKHAADPVDLYLARRRADDKRTQDISAGSKNAKKQVKFA